ncbi:Uncharacterised protein [Mycobacterium tuberculosis]|nr:Uncharacterised protein [Mycobacterium tuberculosis]COX50224.1 Uncharacterised protein [Mycobacterium tuberculosis]
MLPAWRDRDVSPRANRSKTSDCSAAGIPGPLSITCSTTCVGPVLKRVVTIVPGPVCTRALASRLVTTWCNRAASPGMTTGSGGRSSAHW